MAVEGTLDLFQLPEILQVISQQKKTGILTVAGAQDIVSVSFLSGRIVNSDSLNQPQEEGLARLLVSQGILSPAELARANSENQASGKGLIELLVERGFLERQQLLETLRHQTFHLLEQLLVWREGDFKFFSGEEVSHEEGFQPISVEELLIRAAQRMAPPEPPRPKPQPVPAAPGIDPATELAAPHPRQDSRPEIRLVPPGTQGAPAPEAERPRTPPTPAVPPSREVQPAKEERPSPFRRMVAEERTDDLPEGARVGKLLAVALGLALVAVASLKPYGLALPLPWQDHDRASLLRDQRAALFLKVDRAAKTWFLVKGQFPDHLSELVEGRLLAAEDLTDPSGAPLGYVASAESYRLYPLRGRTPQTDAEVDEVITGNFLLDPELTTGRSESESTPLVLVD